MSAEIIQFIPKPNPNREPLLTDRELPGQAGQSLTNGSLMQVGPSPEMPSDVAPYCDGDCA